MARRSVTGQLGFSGGVGRPFLRFAIRLPSPPLDIPGADGPRRFNQFPVSRGLVYFSPASYNERATLSLLAAAAWKSPGCLALEEYVSERKRGERKKKRKHRSPGRVDLWICKNKHSYVIEATQGWIRLDRNPREKTVEVVCARKLKEAIDEAGRSRITAKEEDTKLLAVAFIVPSWRIKKGQKVSGKRSDGKWYPGKVTAVKPRNEEAFVEFDDEDEAWLPFSRIKFDAEFNGKVEKFSEEVKRFKYDGHRVAKGGLLLKAPLDRVPNCWENYAGTTVYYPGVVALLCQTR